MFYPPNHPVIAKRSPQHGIHIAGASANAKSTTFRRPTVTALCAGPSCSNTIAVVPFGYKNEGPMDIKVHCKDCYIPVGVAPVEDVKEKQEWAEEAEEWEEDQDEGGGYVEEW
ncbi:hypothetical protein CC86DRAFT_420450 [Ophiobolus disseminans]|uniref:Uncharacterized protein n=1 Tax=Ophiobolus disseminans TaxID=1469910 RepID=A0A6A6ZXH5_9PLEO|nr:hypothetical protein CC86DRAFT_420450 [Ophiobolus disseminans]